MNSSSEMSKQALRQQMRLVLANLEASNKQNQSKAITNILLASEQYKRAVNIAVYLSMEEEVCTDYIIKDALKSDSKRVYVPQYRTKPTLEMSMLRLYSWSDYESLPKTKWGIRQPSLNDNNREILDKADLILVPGLAFSTKNERLGRGKGFYDRFLSSQRERNKNLATVALAFREQMVDQVTVNEHDQLVDKVIVAHETS